MEDRRLALGLTQRTVAEVLGVSQPHYSKLVGRVVPLTEAMADAMEAWLQAAPSGEAPDPAKRAGRAAEIGRLVRSIERQMRSLNRLLELDGKEPRRPVRRTAKRSTGR